MSGERFSLPKTGTLSGSELSPWRARLTLDAGTQATETYTSM